MTAQLHEPPSELRSVDAEEAPHGSVPQVSGFLTRGFRKYVNRLLRKRFHAIRIAKGTIPQVREGSLLLYANHPSWWDPLIAVAATEHCLAPRRFFAPIDAGALAKYAVLKKLGFYGIDLSTANGARQFLRTTRAILSTGDSATWITPHGRFLDAREQAEFEPGIGHVVSNLDSGLVVPVAVEYPFWDESTPEVLVEFGDPIRIEDHRSKQLSKQDWTTLLEQRLCETQSRLAEKAIARSPDVFDSLTSGRTGIGGLYDLARRLKSWLTGRRFESAHGDRPSVYDGAGS